MSPAVQQTIITVLTLVFSGGVVQLVVFLLKRRSELRSLDAASKRTEAESGSVAISSAEKSLALADLVRDNAVKRADEAVQRAEALEIELGVQVERVRLVTARLAAVELEVSVLRAEIAELRRAAKN